MKRILRLVVFGAGATLALHCGPTSRASTPAPSVDDAKRTTLTDAAGEPGMSKPEGTAADAAPELALDEASAGKTIDVRAGQAITLTLATNPTTGYDWKVLTAPAALGEATSTIAAPDSGADGAATTRRFVWRPRGALGPGDHPLELGYRRSFEKGVAPIKSFRVLLRSAPRAP